MTKLCPICGVSFRVRPSQFDTRKTDSRQCAAKLVSQNTRKRKKDMPLLRCTKCGEYKKVEGFKMVRGYIKSHCYQCEAEQQRERSLNNPEVWKNYRKLHKDKVREWKKISIERVKGSETYIAQRKRAKLRKVNEIRDTYLKDNMKRDGIPITPETIELKRQQIMIHRELKQLKQEVANGIT